MERWLKLYAGFYTHPKIDEAGGDAAWLHVCALCYCAQHPSTNGLVPKKRVPLLSDRKRPQRLAERLVEVGLWHDRGDSYEIHDWTQMQETSEALEAKRADARQRQRKSRMSQRDRAVTHTNGHGHVTGAEEESTSPPSPPRGPSFDDFWTAYPRRVGKPAAQRTWKSKLKAGVDPKDLLLAAENYARIQSERAAPPDRIKHASTFIGPDDHWRDWLPGGAAMIEAEQQFVSSEPTYS